MTVLLPDIARAARNWAPTGAAMAEHVEELWATVIRSLRGGLTADEQVAVLRATIEAVASGRDHLASVRRLWAGVERADGRVEGAEELAEAERRFDRVHAEATRALEARLNPWQPSDPARLEQGLREAREGKAVGPDEARAWFRKKPG
jgi:hypothetical protein